MSNRASLFVTCIVDQVFPNVGVSMASGRTKVSVGSNPWQPRPKLSIAAICERYGGGGHPVVGAVALHASELPRAREIAAEIVEELSRFPV